MHQQSKIFFHDWWIFITFRPAMVDESDLVMSCISLAYGQPRVHVPECLEANCASRTSDKRDPCSGHP
jgi:hypothetical protein